LATPERKGFMMTNIRTIAIVLGDNDFGNTFRPLLESVYTALLHRSGFSREIISSLIREGIKFHYAAYQYRYDYLASGYTNQTVDKTVEYLDKIRILFDEDAEQDVEQRDHDGGAWYLEVATGTVYSY